MEEKNKTYSNILVNALVNPGSMLFYHKDLFHQPSLLSF